MVSILVSANTCLKQEHLKAENSSSQNQYFTNSSVSNALDSIRYPFPPTNRVMSSRSNAPIGQGTGSGVPMSQWPSQENYAPSK